MKFAMNSMLWSVVCILLLVMEMQASDCDIKIVNGSPERPQIFQSSTHFICYLDALKKSLNMPRYGKRLASVEQMPTERLISKINPRSSILNKDWRDIYYYLSEYDE